MGKVRYVPRNPGKPNSCVGYCRDVRGRPKSLRKESSCSISASRKLASEFSPPNPKERAVNAALRFDLQPIPNGFANEIARIVSTFATKVASDCKCDGLGIQPTMLKWEEKKPVVQPGFQTLQIPLRPQQTLRMANRHGNSQSLRRRVRRCCSSLEISNESAQKVRHYGHSKTLRLPTAWRF